MTCDRMAGVICDRINALFLAGDAAGLRALADRLQGMAGVTIRSGRRRTSRRAWVRAYGVSRRATVAAYGYHAAAAAAVAVERSDKSRQPGANEYALALADAHDAGVGEGSL